MSGALDARGVARLQDMMAGHVERSHVPAWPGWWPVVARCTSALLAR